MQPQTPTQGRSQMQSRKRSASEPGESLILCSPYGGFTPDGSEYVITLREGEVLPAPWVNVLANRTFGSVVSESGNAYTWAENAHEFRLTRKAASPRNCVWPWRRKIPSVARR